MTAAFLIHPRNVLHPNAEPAVTPAAEPQISAVMELSRARLRGMAALLVTLHAVPADQFRKSRETATP